MENCPFCKIVEGELPSFKIYEDNLVKAILDINASSPGHILVIPKKHYTDIFDTPEETLKQISVVSKKMAILCQEKLNCTGVNILNASGKSAQQSVFHLHFHVVPRYDDDGLDLWFHGNAANHSSLEDVYRKLI